MINLKGTALALALLVAPVLAQDTSVSGTWKVTGDVVGNAVDLLCDFKQDGKTLAGSCKSAGSDKANEIVGEVDDKKVTWKMDTEYDSQKIKVTFTGALDGPAQLKGDIDVQPFGVGGAFTAAKQEAKKEEPGKPQ